MLLVLAAAFAGESAAAPQSSANFAIRADAVNAGVADMGSASYALSSSLGDTVATGASASVNFGLASGFRSQLNFSIPTMLRLISVFSRKVHAGTGARDLPIDLAQVIGGPVTVEPRILGTGHVIHFRFDAPVVATGALASVDATGAAIGTASAGRLGNDVVVTLTAVPDNRRVALSLTGVNGSANVSTAIGFLVGDVSGNRAVNAVDISAVKAKAGQAITDVNFLFDLDVSGAIGQADASIAKSRSGRALP